MPPIIQLGAAIMGESESRGFSLPNLRSYRGRVNAPIPASGIVLPSARGGRAPITYAVSNLPSGLSFNAGTRAVTGSPTVAHATRAVDFSATDSASPAETITETFQFPVVSSSARDHDR